MTNIDTTINAAWQSHTQDPQQALADIMAIDFTPLGYDQASGWLKIFGHLTIGHLGDQQQAQQRMSQAAPQNPACEYARGEFLAIVAICRGDGDKIDWAALAEQGRPYKSTANLAIELHARAAGELTHQEVVSEGAELYQRTIAMADKAEFEPKDPAARALAVTSNNLAGTLEGFAKLSEDQKQLIVLAAEQARRYWAIAGTAVHIERAEYRLAMVQLKLRNFMKAIHHARLCEQICHDHQLDAVEQFYASAALSQIHREKCLALREAMDEATQGMCQLPE